MTTPTVSLPQKTRAARKGVRKRSGAAAPAKKNGLGQDDASARLTRMDDSPRGRLLRAAAHLFLTLGYEKTTVRDIARGVGILSGSIFHHFESKEDILEAVMLEVSELTTERMRQAAQTARSPLAKVRALVRAELQCIHGDTSEAMTLLITEWRSLNPEAQQRVLRVRDRYEAVWKSALVDARKDLQAIDELILRRLVQGMTSGTARWYRPRGPMSLDELAEQIVSLLRKRGRDD